MNLEEAFKKIVHIGLAQSIKIVLPFIHSKSINISTKEAQKNIKDVYTEKHIYQGNDIHTFKEKIKSDELDLSIIIPVYNSEKFLEKCLNSLIKQQTKYNYEIITVNDGSTDSSGKILSNYKNNYDIIKVVTQDNKGISEARNVGLEYARGKYVGFIDNDDYVVSYYIEKLLNRAYESNADMVKCGHFRYDSFNEKILSNMCQQDVSIKGNMGDKILEFDGYIWGGIMLKSLWSDIRFPVGFWYEDMITRIIIMRKCRRFEYLGQPLYYYNVHINNASTVLWKSANVKSLDQYFLAKELVEYSNKIEIEEDDTLYRILLHELGITLWMRTRELNEKMRKNVFVLASQFILKYRSKGEMKLSFTEKYFDECFKNSDYRKWNLCSIYMIYSA